VSALAERIAVLRTVCAGLPDRRKGPLLPCAYTMADIGLSAFSLFFAGSPSFLAHQRQLAEGQGRSNCQTLFGIAAIPSDDHIRQMLDGAPTAAFDPLLLKVVETPGVLAPFQRLGGRVLIALDGTEYFHSFLGPGIVAPDHQHVLSLPPAFIAPQGGAEKQDCERHAARRWLARHGGAFGHLRPAFLGDDLFACQPLAAAVQAVGANFILTCTPASHKSVTEYLHGAELAEHRETVRKRGKRTTMVYRWLADVPLRDSEEALKVTWVSVELFNDKGKRTYGNNFVTDLPVTAGTVAELAACGRAR
jgi:hypothetical protein